RGGGTLGVGSLLADTFELVAVGAVLGQALSQARPLGDEVGCIHARNPLVRGDVERGGLRLASLERGDDRLEPIAPPLLRRVLVALARLRRDDVEAVLLAAAAQRYVAPLAVEV